MDFVVGTRAPEGRASVTDEEGRKQSIPFREDSLASQASLPDGVPQPPESRNSLGAIGNDVPAGKAKEETESEAPAVQDPLAGMAPIDKWGLKGLRTLMNNYPDYNALICGIDPSTLGVDINSNELVFSGLVSETIHANHLAGRFPPRSTLSSTTCPPDPQSQSIDYQIATTSQTCNLLSTRSPVSTRRP